MLLAILTACHADDPAAPPLLGSLAITPEAAIVVGGGVLALTATGVDGSGNPMPADVSWTVSDTTVATVAQDGSPNLWATSACGVTTVGDGLCWGSADPDSSASAIPRPGSFPRR